MTNTASEIPMADLEQKRGAPDQVERSKKNEVFPLSFAQRRLWFLDKLQPGSAVYNVPTVLRLSGPIEWEAFRKGLRAVIARHEALRATFSGGTEEPVQKITPPAEVPLELVDLSAVPAGKREREAERIAGEQVRKPFDLEKDGLIRAMLIRLQPEEHILALVIHHIASDEWSLRILFHEWAECYAGFRAGREPALPALPARYVDFAQWQRDWIGSDGYVEELAYWREKLKASPVLQLPADHARAAGQTAGGALRRRVLPKDLGDRLKELSRSERCTLFMSLLAVFKVLLHRYTGMEDLVVGCPIAGRNRLESEALIGFFVNTLAIRTDLTGNPSYREVLAKVRESTLGAYANQEMPFDKLVEELHPERSASHMPLVQVLFSLNNDFIEAELFPGVRSEEIEVHTETSKFDMTVVVKEMPQGLETVVEYKTALFERETIDRFLGHFQRLLESAVENPDEKISRLEMLQPEERQQVVSDWNRTRREYPRSLSVCDIFEQQAARSPEAIALEYGNRTITYRELDLRANQVARRLLGEGAEAEGCIGVYMERSIEMVTAFLAILKAGCVYVPLDISYPKERLEFMISDAGMRLIVADAAHRGELPEQIKTVCLDAEWEELNSQAVEAPARATTGDSPAYMIYTSGSTGRPKGVVIPQRGITRLVLNADYVQLSGADRVAQASNASFDAATFEIWGALLNGARLVGVTKETTLCPSEFEAFLAREGITVLFLTTALFNQVARERPQAFGTLKTVMFGGEAVDPKWVRAILECAPPERLLHVYGPTENTTFSTWHLVTQSPEEGDTVPIGRPIANSTVYVLGPDMQPLPVGVPGEVYVGGDGVACGYWKRPELTAERFVRNPFGGSDATLYRTGDLAKLDREGNVEFVGRIDHQVKLRGFRLELGEIENLLARHPGIANAVVMLREDVPGDRRLAAYVIPRGEAPGAGELKSFLKAQLPEYMVPAAFVALKEFPLTPNEKVDRKALPAPETSRPELNKTFIAPRDALEQQLTKIWEKILGVQPIGVADNFFDLGGHSLMAVRVFSQIEKVLEKKLPLATLFRAPTIEEIARIMREENQTKAWSTIVDIQPKGSRPPFFWIHTLGGDGGGGFFYYRKLAELLGPDQPSFGIRSPQKPFSRIEEMARFYIKEIQKFQPRGPYFLGGFCFGGNVAFEMAQQLRAAGAEVGLLIMLESSPPNVSHKQSWSATAAKYSIENIVENVKDFVAESPGNQLTLLKSKGKRLKDKFKKRLAASGEAKGSGLSQILDLSTYPEGYVTYAETHWQALTEYHPAPYAGEITLFRAKKQSLGNFNHTLGWDALADDRVNVTVIPGTHESMLQEPNVQIVAARLRELLEGAAKRGIIGASVGASGQCASVP